MDTGKHSSHNYGSILKLSHNYYGFQGKIASIALMSAEFGTRIFKPSRDDKASLDWFQIKVLLRIYTIYFTNL
jgi:hypothetical protein